MKHIKVKNTNADDESTSFSEFISFCRQMIFIENGIIGHALGEKFVTGSMHDLPINPIFRLMS